MDTLLKLLNFVKFKVLRVNFIIFILFSIILTLVAEKLPSCIYFYKKWLYRERRWERGGKIYEDFFRVKRWKSFLPDIGDFLKWRFSKKHLYNTNFEYIHRFLTESCKAEFTHWMIILSSFLFVFWGGIFTALKIMLLALVLNMPYIIIQRYNRPRLVRLLHKSHEPPYELAPAKV